MENSKNYHDEQNNLNTLKMREVVATLPSFCKQFFRGIQEYTSSRTRLAYAYDLRVFFEFIHNHNSVLAKMEITDFPLSVLDQIGREDIEEDCRGAVQKVVISVFLLVVVYDGVVERRFSGVAAYTLHLLLLALHALHHRFFDMPESETAERYGSVRGVIFMEKGVASCTCHLSFLSVL